jgi:hypothetical protein
MSGAAWEVYRDGERYGTAATREAAQGLVERPYKSGRVVICNVVSGEEWTRNRGSWFKSRSPDKIARTQPLTARRLG